MLSIGEVAQRAGLRPSALRYYEEVGLVSPSARVSGRRQYDPTVLDRLRVIACAQAAGFTIAEIRDLLAREDDVAGGWRALARRKLREVDALIDQAQTTRRLLEQSLGCDCRSLEECAASGACSGEARSPHGAKSLRRNGTDVVSKATRGRH